MQLNEKMSKIEELKGDLFLDYVKTLSVIDYYKENNATELSENLEELAKKLGDTRKEIKQLDDKFGIVSDENKAKIVELSVKISDIEGRIDLCEMIRSSVSKAEAKLKEIKWHYDNAIRLSNNNDKVESLLK